MPAPDSIYPHLKQCMVQQRIDRFRNIAIPPIGRVEHIADLPKGKLLRNTGFLLTVFFYPQRADGLPGFLQLQCKGFLFLNEKLQDLQAKVSVNDMDIDPLIAELVNMLNERNRMIQMNK